MVLGLVITKVVFSWAPKDFELALGFAALEPVKRMSMAFDIFFLRVPLEKSSAVVLSNLELGGGLWVPHIDEAGSHEDIILGIDICGTYLILRR